MGDFLSFLLFAGVFYMMMRHGCGAHMVHGNKEEKPINHTDPVCGMKVSQTSGYGVMQNKQLYRFCSRQCLDRFESEPARYINQSTIQKEVHHE